MNKNIVITGGLGYIGSNTCIHIPEDYHNIIIIDNLSNSDESVLEKIKFLNIKHRIIFYPVDLLNIDEIENIFNIYRPYSVIHFAGLKSVYQSIKDPFSYYNNNLLSTLNLSKLIATNETDYYNKIDFFCKNVDELKKIRENLISYKHKNLDRMNKFINDYENLIIKLL